MSATQKLTEQQKAQRLAYYHANKEKLGAYSKEYRKEHAAEISAKRCAKVECNVCGAVVVKLGMTRHQESPKCKNHHKKPKTTTTEDGRVLVECACCKKMANKASMKNHKKSKKCLAHKHKSQAA